VSNTDVASKCRGVMPLIDRLSSDLIFPHDGMFRWMLACHAEGSDARWRDGPSVSSGHGSRARVLTYAELIIRAAASNVMTIC